MKRPLSTLLSALLLASSGAEPAAASEASSKRKDKILLRATSGLIGSFGIGGLAFLKDQWALGADYRVESNSTRIIRGINFIGRHYPLGLGTYVDRKDGGGQGFGRHRRWSPYVAAEASLRDYSFRRTSTGTTSSSSTVTPVEGSVLTLNALVGLDFRITSYLEATAEGGLPLLTTFRTDPQLAIQSYVANFGLNYLW
jgi:hypothetical protein